MRVIDHVEGAWYLLEDGLVLYLDVNADPSSGTVRLSADEVEQYAFGGRDYVDGLARHLSHHARERWHRHDEASAARAYEAIVAYRRELGLPSHGSD